MALPQVGAQVQLQNYQQFIAACNSSVNAINGLSNSVQQMANNTTRATGQAGRNTSTFFNQLGTGARSASTSVVSSFNYMGDMVSRTAGIITASVGLAEGAIVGLVAATAVMGNQFVQQMVNAGVAVEATNTDLSLMNDTVIQMGRSWTESASAIAKVLPSYMRAGGSIKDLNDGVLDQITALKVASAGELGYEQAILLVTGAQGAFNISGKESWRITNSLTAAANKSAISFKDIYRTVPQAAAVYGAMGYTIEDLTSVTAMLGQEYLRNSDAGTAMKQMVISLMNPSKKATEYMQQYGISLFDAKGNVLPLVEVIGQLHKAFGDIDDRLDDSTIMNMEKGKALAQIFGSDALRPALILAKQGPAAFMAMKSSMDATSAMAISQKMLEPAAAQAKILTNQFEALAIVIGEQTEPAARALLKDFNDLVREITPQQVGMIGKAFGAMLSGVGFQDLQAEAEKIFSGDVLRAFNSFVELLYTIRNVVMNEIVPSFIYLTNSITGGASIAFVLSTIFESLTTSTQLFADIVVVVNRVLGDLINYIRQTEIGAAALEIVLNGILALPLVTLVSIFVAIAAAISSILGPVLLVSLAVGAVMYAFQHWDQIVNIVNGIVSTIVGLFAGVLAAVQAVINPIIQIFSTVFNTVISVVSGAINTIVSIVQQGLPIIGAIVGAIFLEIAAQAAITFVLIASEIVQMIVPAFGIVVSYIIGTVIPAFALLGTRAVVALANIPGAIASIGTTVVTVGKQVILFAEIFITTLARNVVAAVLPAIGTIIAALWSIILPIAAVAAAAVALYIAWKTNFLGIQDFVGKVLTWVSEQISKFINWVKGLPVIGQFVEGIATSINLVGGQVNETMAGAGQAVSGFVDSARGEIDKYISGLTGALPVMDDFQKKLDQIHKDQASAADETERNREAQRRQDEAAGIDKKAEGFKGTQPGFLPDDGEKKLSQADKLKAAIREIMAALKDMPIMTADLAEYLGKIAVDFPERLTPMLSALKASYGLLQQIANIKKQILAIDLETLLITMKQNIYQAQMAAIQAKMRVVELSHQKELITLRTQIAAIDLQIIPIRQRIAEIDREITKLSRDNLDLKRREAEINIALLPYRKQLLDIDQKLQELRWKDYKTLIAQAEAELSILPARQKIAELERQINDVVNQRVALRNKEADIIAQRQLTLLDRQLKITNKELDEAWKKMDVPKILNLEEQVNSLEEQKSSAQDYADQIKAQIEDQQYLDDIATLRLEKEKLAYTELIKPTEDYLFSLKQQMDLQQAIADLAQLRLEAEKQAIEQLMQPLQNELAAIQYEIDAEKTRNQLRIIDLQIEKQALEDILEPLEAVRQKYQDQIDIINAQIVVEQYSYAIALADIQSLDAEQEVFRTQLLETKAQLEQTYSALIQEYVLSLAQSKAFTVEEGYEVAKRLGVWTDQVNKLKEIFTEFSNIRDEANNLTKAINDIPKTVDIVITTHYKSEGAPGAVPSPIPSKAEGGYIPGPFGKPILTIMHGGEFVIGLQDMIGLRNTVPTSVNMAQTRPLSRASTYNYNTNYNIDANYSTMQSPATIKMDLQALALKSRR